MVLISWATMMFRSTPLREGRPGVLTDIRGLIHFRSTPLREGRPARLGSINRFQIVSIHAPARGGTVVQGAVKQRVKNSFDPRPCARGDSPFPHLCNPGMQFRSTPLREGRRPRPTPTSP